MGRAISEDFMKDLKEGGILSEIAKKVRNDDTLMLALRGTYINIYYRGGNILRLTEQSKPKKYLAKFDNNYVKDGSPELPFLPEAISTEEDCRTWVKAIPHLKEIMDFYFANCTNKAEREFQQLVAWENNRSALANETEYFITDIEFATDFDGADGKKRARIDMLGLKWLSNDRKKGTKCTPVLIEMKYGNGAYNGSSGINDHLDAMTAIIGDSDACTKLSQMIVDQFRQLGELGLLRLNASHQDVAIAGKPEVVFLLSNSNPRSTALAKILAPIKAPENFELRFFVSNYAGYAMHEKCMLNLGEFKKKLGLDAAL